MGAVAVVVCLTAAAAALFVAGAQKNAQITRLKHQGVVASMTVGGCRGLLGGSGSNAAGYACWGTLHLDGRSYREGIPGSALLAPGAEIKMVSVPGDPGLLSAPSALAGEQPSAKVFLLPAALSALFMLLVGGWLLRGRRGQPALRSLFGLGRGRRLGDVAGGV